MGLEGLGGAEALDKRMVRRGGTVQWTNGNEMTSLHAKESSHLFLPNGVVGFACSVVRSRFWDVAEAMYCCQLENTLLGVL